MARLTGKQLAANHQLTFAQSRYRESGDWYHLLTVFPAALMDEGGYIGFASKDDYDAFISRGEKAGIKQTLVTNTLTVKGGIAARHGYIRFKASSTFPEEIADPATVIEGAKRLITVNAYERDRSAREICIRKWGTTCFACEFNFRSVYGELGEGFIHVHHLTPISAIAEAYVLTPESDMRPVCPNCHAMLHRHDPPLSIEELRSVIGQEITKSAGKPPGPQ